LKPLDVPYLRLVAVAPCMGGVDWNDTRCARSQSEAGHSLRGSVD